MKKIQYIMMFTVISFLSMSRMIPSSSDNSMYGAEKEVKESVAGEHLKLDYNYMKDKYRVYFAGKPIEGVNLSSFEVFDNRIARDKFNVYNLDKKLKNIDIETFKYIGEGCPSDIGYGEPGGCICFYSESKYRDKNGEYTANNKSRIEKFKLNID